MTVQIIGQFVDVAMLSGKSIQDAGIEQAEVSQIVREFGATVRLLHPDTNDKILSRYFVVDVQQDAMAEMLAQRLRMVPSVDGAYVKAAGEAPSELP